MLLIEVAFWAVLALIVYAYLGFPLVLLVRGLRARPTVKNACTPTVSLIVIAHNEQAAIEAKLENVLSLDYPREQLEVFVGSDGSEDDTNAIVARYADQGVLLRVFPRQGKIATLNATVENATGDVLVFSDANSIFDSGALRALTSCFADPQVGAVAGNQCYSVEGEHAASLGERVYWSFDRFLKKLQSRCGNATSSTGAIHAIRRELFQPVPPAVSDDFVISTRAIEQGYRLVFEPDAIAREPVTATDQAEFQRKVRVITRGLRGLWVVRRLFNPFRYGFYSFQLASHKLLRWSVFVLLPVVLVLSAILAGSQPLYKALLVLQLVCYGMALGALIMRSTALARQAIFRPCKLPYYFCLVNLAAACGWLQLLGGRKVDRWNSPRSEVASDQKSLATSDASAVAGKS